MLLLVLLLLLQAVMPALAAAAPHLRSLNLSWLRMVKDWGLQQLAPLTQLQDLNLRATGGFYVEVYRLQSGSACSLLLFLARRHTIVYA
jgi:hypothetical protein